MLSDSQMKDLLAVARAIATPLFYREMVSRSARSAVIAAIGAMLAGILLLGSGLFIYIAVHGVGDRQTGLLIAGALAVIGAFCGGMSAYCIGRLDSAAPLKKILDAFLKGWNG